MKNVNKPITTKEIVGFMSSLTSAKPVTVLSIVKPLHPQAKAADVVSRDKAVLALAALLNNPGKDLRGLVVKGLTTIELEAISKEGVMAIIHRLTSGATVSTVLASITGDEEKPRDRIPDTGAIVYRLASLLNKEGDLRKTVINVLEDRADFFKDSKAMSQEDYDLEMQFTRADYAPAAAKGIAAKYALGEYEVPTPKVVEVLDDAKRHLSEGTTPAAIVAMLDPELPVLKTVETRIAIRRLDDLRQLHLLFKDKNKFEMRELVIEQMLVEGLPTTKELKPLAVGDIPVRLANLADVREYCELHDFDDEDVTDENIKGLLAIPNPPETIKDLHQFLDYYASNANA